MKTEAGCAPAPLEVREKHPRGEARGRPRWRSSFLGDPGAKVFWELTEKAHRRSRGGGNGFFHGPSIHQWRRAVNNIRRMQ